MDPHSLLHSCSSSSGWNLGLLWRRSSAWPAGARYSGHIRGIKGKVGSYQIDPGKHYLSVIVQILKTRLWRQLHKSQCYRRALAHTIEPDRNLPPSNTSHRIRLPSSASSQPQSWSTTSKRPRHRKRRRETDMQPRHMSSEPMRQMLQPSSHQVQHMEPLEHNL
jgi:hypothetical protein